ncbi:MAG: gamma carbonic anhydrase family protein [Gammaproteobacteria bacterium]|nr:gamma carbonic anhydrase family protein [Gammaproteobacteria bacterium]
MIFATGDRVPSVAADAWVAPNAVVTGDVQLASRANVWFGAVLRGDVERLSIGHGTNIQDNCVLHSDPGAPLVLGERVTVGHLVMLHGCHVGDCALIGIGSIVLNHARIGARSIVGAGSLVTEGKEFPEGVLIIGTPARVVRPLTAEEIARLPESAERYMERAALYRRTLREMP